MEKLDGYDSRVYQNEIFLKSEVFSSLFGAFIQLDFVHVDIAIQPINIC